MKKYYHIIFWYEDDKEGWKITSEFIVHSSSKQKAINWAIKEMKAIYDKFECYETNIIEMD